MVISLQQRLAIVAIIGVLLIPLLATNLRGLTHLLTCTEDVQQTFAIAGLDGGDPLLTSSTSLERGDDGAVDDGTAADPELPLVVAGPTGLLCDALDVEVSAASRGEDVVLLTVEVVNDTELPWSGTLGLTADGDAVTVRSGLNAEFGRVDPGQSATRTLELLIPPGQTEIQGTLLLGP
jgi:hypothetical protein